MRRAGVLRYACVCALNGIHQDEDKYAILASTSPTLRFDAILESSALVVDRNQAVDLHKLQSFGLKESK